MGLTSPKTSSVGVTALWVRSDAMQVLTLGDLANSVFLMILSSSIWNSLRKATSGPHSRRLNLTKSTIWLPRALSVFRSNSPSTPVSYTHLRAHETDSYLVCRLLLE